MRLFSCGAGTSTEMQCGSRFSRLHDPRNLLFTLEIMVSYLSNLYILEICKFCLVSYYICVLILTFVSNVLRYLKTQLSELKRFIVSNFPLALIVH